MMKRIILISVLFAVVLWGIYDKKFHLKLFFYQIGRYILATTYFNGFRGNIAA